MRGASPSEYRVHASSSHSRACLLFCLAFFSRVHFYVFEKNPARTMNARPDCMCVRLYGPAVKYGWKCIERKTEKLSKFKSAVCARTHAENASSSTMRWLIFFQLPETNVKKD